jgi:hypothetical protein
VDEKPNKEEHNVDEKPKTYFSPEFIKNLKENTVMSPHTILLINNPLHAYTCSGEACRKATNEHCGKATNDQG